MNTKKILGVVAVLALVAVAMVGAGAADTTANVSVSPAVGEETEFTTLAAAYTAIEDSNTLSTQYTITVNNSHNTAGMGTDNKNVNVLIDLNGKVVTFTAPSVGSAGHVSQAFRVLDNSTVEIKNGTLQISDAVIPDDVKTSSAMSSVKYWYIGSEETLGTNAYIDYVTNSATAGSNPRTVKYSDLYATVFNVYGNLTLDNVTVDATYANRVAAPKYLDSTGLGVYDLTCSTLKHPTLLENTDSAIVVNEGTVTMKGVTVTSPVSTKGALVRAVAVQNQCGDSHGYGSGTMYIDTSSATEFNGDVIVDGTLNGTGYTSTLEVKSSSTLTINGNLTTTSTSAVNALGHLTLNGVSSSIQGTLTVVASTLEVKSGSVEILTSSGVSGLEDKSVIIQNGGTLIVPNSVSLDAINAKLKEVYQGAVVIQQATSTNSGNKEVFTTHVEAGSGSITTANATVTEVNANSGTTIVGLTSEIAYTFVIPADVTLSSTDASATYSITMTTPQAGTSTKYVRMKLTASDNFASEKFYVAYDTNTKVEYTITPNGGSAITSMPAEIVNVLTSGTTGTKDVTYHMAGTAPKAGTYKDTLTFELSVDA